MKVEFNIISDTIVWDTFNIEETEIRQEIRKDLENAERDVNNFRRMTREELAEAVIRLEETSGQAQGFISPANNAGENDIYYVIVKR